MEREGGYANVVLLHRKNILELYFLRAYYYCGEEATHISPHLLFFPSRKLNFFLEAIAA